jgi:hypothetical protein
MNPFFSREMAQQHIGDLRRSARRERARDLPAEFAEDPGLTVRALEARDIGQVRLLAALEGRHYPNGPVLVGEVNDEVVAALPLDGEPPLADPFRRSQHVVALLELRARQMRNGSRKPRKALLSRVRRMPRAA